MARCRILSLLRPAHPGTPTRNASLKNLNRDSGDVVVLRGAAGEGADSLVKLVDDLLGGFGAVLTHDIQGALAAKEFAIGRERFFNAVREQENDIAGFEGQ